jgi:hypothetical protein
VLLVGGQVFLGIDGIHGAFWDAHGAVNALIGVDGQEVGAFAKAIHRANVHTVGVFALDTGFGNNVGHDGLGIKKSAGGLAQTSILREIDGQLVSQPLLCMGLKAN